MVGMDVGGRRAPPGGDSPTVSRRENRCNRPSAALPSAWRSRPSPRVVRRGPRSLQGKTTMTSFDIVFEAGGAKGLAFIGALEVLFRSGHKARRLVGTSAGAITATCLAAGYSPQELLEASKERRGDRATFASFLSPP